MNSFGMAEIAMLWPTIRQRDNFKLTSYIHLKVFTAMVTRLGLVMKSKGKLLA